MYIRNKKKSLLMLTIGIAIIVAGVLMVMPCSAGQPKGEVTVAVFNTFETTGLDCLTGIGSGAMVIKNLFFDSLVTKQADGKISPALAKSWEIAKDWSYIKFTLDERAVFHNGDPVRAEDVKFSIERATDPKMKFLIGGELKREIKSVEIIDDHHLIIYLNNPYPGFFDRCAGYFGIVPKNYIERVGNAEFAKHPIGAGPFRSVEFEQDVYLKAEAVEDHYRKTPEVKTLILKVVPEHSTRLAMLQTGEADIARLNPPNVPVIKKDPNLRIYWAKYSHARSVLFFDLAFPDEASPWHDIRVRKAAAYAINRKAICEKVLHGAAEPWGNLLAPYHVGYDPTIEPFPYDPEKAKKLLTEAGYPGGFDTTYTTSPKFKLESEAIVANLNAVGIRAKLKMPEHGTWVRQITQHKLRGIGDNPCPYWAGRSLTTMLESIISSKSKWTYVTNPEAETMLATLKNSVDKEIIIAEAKKLSIKYPEWMFRSLSWAKHIPYGLGPRVASWGPVPGWARASGFETIKIK